MEIIMKPITSLYELLNETNWQPSEQEIVEMAMEYESLQYAANSYDDDAQFYGENV